MLQGVSSYSQLFAVVQLDSPWISLGNSDNYATAQRLPYNEVVHVVMT